MGEDSWIFTFFAVHVGHVLLNQRMVFDKNSTYDSRNENVFLYNVEHVRATSINV